MASDTGKARNLIGELRGYLTKLGETVDQHSSKHVTCEPNEAQRNGADCCTLTGIVATALRQLQEQGINEVAKALNVKANDKIDDKLKTAPERTVQIIAETFRLSAGKIMRGILEKHLPSPGEAAEEEVVEEVVVAAEAEAEEEEEHNNQQMNAKALHMDAEDSKFAVSSKVLQAGNLDHFDMGLDVYNGKPVGDNIEMQMKLEFDKTLKWTAKNAGLNIPTTLKEEWEFVVNPTANKLYPGMFPAEGTNTAGAHEAEAIRPSREPREIGEFMKMEITKKAKLTRPEVIAVRLYTGPAYVPINKGLRAGGRDRTDKTVGNFPVTCSVLNSAIRKLSKVTPIAKGRILYRGLSGVKLGTATLDRKQFVELGFSSATPSMKVALAYSRHTGQPTLLKIEVGQIDNGASFEEFSQFPIEEEVCLPPLSNFELIDDGRVQEDGLCIFRAKLNVNLKARTLDELKQERKVAVQEFSRVLALDYQQMAGGRKSEQLLEITEAEVDGPIPEFFNNYVNFWNVQSKLFEVYRKEMEEAAKESESRADVSSSWRRKVELLQRALKIIRRSTVGYKEAVAMSQRVVESLPDDVAGLELGDAEQAVVVDALQEHAELLIEAGGEANFKLAVTTAARVVNVIAKAKHTRKAAVAKAVQAFSSPRDLGALPLERCASTRDQDLDLDVAAARYWRARAHVQLKQWDEALPDVEAAVRIRRAVLGEENEEVPKTLSLQGQILFGKRKYEDALEVHEKAKGLRIKVFGEDHLEVAASLSNIAKALGKLGRVSDAKGALEQTLQIQRRQLGRRHKYVAFTEEAMGNLLKQEGSLGSAAVFFAEALRTAEFLDEEWFATRLKNSIESLDQAKEEMRSQAMACAAEAESLPHEQWQNKLVLLQKALRQIKKVSEGFKESLDMSKRVVGVLPEDVLLQTLAERDLSEAMDALQEHVELLIERGGDDNWRRAVEVADRVVAARRNADRQGENASREQAGAGLATALYWRARAHVQLKEWDEALPDVEEAVRIRRAVLGEENEEVPKTLSLQGQILFGKRKYEDALEVHEKAKGLRIKVFGEDHLEVAASLSNIAKALGKLGRVSDAKGALEQTLQIQRRQLGRRHKYVAFTEEAMGNLFKQEGRMEEAVQHFQEALRTAKRLEDTPFKERLQQSLKDIF